MTQFNIGPYWLMGLLLLAGISPGIAAEKSCEATGDTQLWISPLMPTGSEPVKIMAVSTEGPLSDLIVLDKESRKIPLTLHSRGGPPWSVVAYADDITAGDYQAFASRGNQVTACRSFTVGKATTQVNNLTWGLATEAFFSAWIEELFGVPRKEPLSFPSLEPVLRNKNRNFLYNYQGRNEDKNLSLTPDCADLPYILRAYFAWKVGLPFAFRACGRGSGQKAPQCGQPKIRTEFTEGSGSQTLFRNLAREVADTVHSGSARTSLDDEHTDFYPVPLERRSLWPGTIYADPYGHVLMLVEWVPQTEKEPGLLFAVDAQPDNTVARKRFWEGNFLFANDENAGSGFKHFRPLVQTSARRWRPLANDELSDHPGFAPMATAPDQQSADDFYAGVAKLINPLGLAPEQAYEDSLDALVEQLETRVTSVDNGEAFFRKQPGSVIAMPAGAAIFQTIGPWEDYSTPSRDMRLLIAIKVLNDLPEKIVRHPELFVLNGQNPYEAKAGIERHHALRVLERSIRYTRTDGSSWELPLATVLTRKTAFEMAYNPNDCPERRWGAKPGTEEFSTCRRQAPIEQRQIMERHRSWFRELRRPAG